MGQYYFFIFSLSYFIRVLPDLIARIFGKPVETTFRGIHSVLFMHSVEIQSSGKSDVFVTSSAIQLLCLSTTCRFEVALCDTRTVQKKYW